MEKIKCKKKFCFGLGKIYVGDTKYVIPIVTKSLENDELVVEVQVCEVDASVPLLCGKDLMERWRAVIDVEQKIMKIKTCLDEEGDKRRVEMKETRGDILLWR